MAQRVTVTGVSLFRDFFQGRSRQFMRVYVLARLDGQSGMGAGFGTVVKRAPSVLFDAVQGWDFPCEVSIELDTTVRVRSGDDEVIRSMKPVCL